MTDTTTIQQQATGWTYPSRQRDGSFRRDISRKAHFWNGHALACGKYPDWRPRPSALNPVGPSERGRCAQCVKAAQ